jgi:hypothetical protein
LRISKRLGAFASLVARRDAALIAALVVAVHLANAILAGWIGYLSPDSWDYLRLAFLCRATKVPPLALSFAVEGK